MENKYESYLEAVVKGIPAAYSNLLNKIYNKDILVGFPNILNYILKQEDLTSCDYYALYDCTFYILDSLTTTSEYRSIFINKFVPKLILAGEKGNLGAMVCLLVFKKTLDTLDSKKDLYDDTRISCLKLIAQSSSNKPSKQHLPVKEKTSWAYFYMSLFLSILNKEQETSNRYLRPATKHNGAAAHYFSEIHLNNDKEINKAIFVLKSYENKYTLLFCLNLSLSRIFIFQCENQLVSGDMKHDKMHTTWKLVSNFKNYNIGINEYLSAHVQLSPPYNSPAAAIECLKRAVKAGHPKAAEELVKLEGTVKQRKIPDFIPKKTQCLGRNYLQQRNNAYIISFSENMARENIVEVGPFDETFIEEKLFNEILNEINTNNKINAIVFQRVSYGIDFIKLIDAIKNRENIHTLELYYCRLPTKDWVRLSLFIQATNHIKSLKLCHPELGFNSQKESKGKDNTVKKMDYQSEHNIMDTSIINLLANAKNLEKIHIESIPFLELDQDKVARFLLALKNNNNLQKTKISITYIVFNNKNLLLLSDILNQFRSIDILFGEEDDPATRFDSEGLENFTLKITGNSSLRHLGLTRPFLDEKIDNKLITATMDLVQVLVRETKIVSLTLREVFLFGEKKSRLSEFCNLVQSNKYLKVLNLSNNSFNDKDAIKIAYIFRRNSNIEKLNLSDNPISHVPIEVLCETLTLYPNNLLKLNLDDIEESNCESDFDLKKYTTALGNFIAHRNCKLQVLYLSSSTILDLLEPLKQNQTLRTLSFGGITFQQLDALTLLAQINTRINRIFYCYDSSDDNDADSQDKKITQEQIDSTEEKLKTQLAINKANNSSSVMQDHNFLFQEMDDKKPTKEILPIQRQKATLETFSNFLESANVQYELTENKEISSLIFEFPSHTLAKIVTDTINSNCVIAKLSDKSITIPNYSTIDEIEISSLTLVLKSKLSKEQPTPPKNKVTLLSLLADVKKILLLEEDKHLNILIAEDSNLTTEYRNGLLIKIKNILTAREIKFYSANYQICVYDYEELPESKIFGIATELKVAVTKIYKAAKNKTLKNVSNNENRIEKRKIKKIKLSRRETPEKTEIKTLSISQPIIVDAKEEEDVEPSQQIECVTFTDKIEHPTNLKFQKLMIIINQNKGEPTPSPLDKNVIILIKYYDELLSLYKSSDDEMLLAYCSLYYSLRICELTNNYLHIHFSNDLNLTRSAYGITTILADVPDYFLPDDPVHALLCLNKHPQSLLTINKKILLELFDENINLKNILAGGFRNVCFYHDFYEINANPKALRINPKKELAESPLNILTKIQTITEFVRNAISQRVTLVELLSNPSKYQLELSAAKGAIFLLGHFIRLLRDNKDFCKKVLNTVLSKDRYSRALEDYLDNILDPIIVSIRGYNLAEKLAELNGNQVSKIVELSNFKDHCLLLIEARNLIRHNIHENDEIKPLEFEEIHFKSVAIISSYFISSEKFFSKIKKLINLENDRNSKEDPKKTFSAMPQTYFFNTTQQVQTLDGDVDKQESPKP